MRTTRPAALTLAAVLALTGAACGGDDDEEGGGVELGGEVDAGDGSDTTLDLGDLGDLSGECEVFAEAAIAFGAAFSGSGEADFDQLADAMAEFADEVPDEIQDDVEVLAEAYRAFAEAAGDIDFSDPEAFNDPEVAARLAEAGEIFNSAEVTEASENLTAFTEANCDISTG